MSQTAQHPKQLLEEMNAAVWMRTHLPMKMMLQMSLLNVDALMTVIFWMKMNQMKREHVAAGANGHHRSIKGGV